MPDDTAPNYNDDDILPQKILDTLRPVTEGTKYAQVLAAGPQPHEIVQKYAPPSIREAGKKVNTRLQSIAQNITALTYREAMAMGKGIAEKIKNGVKSDSKAATDESVVALVSAIQDWAWAWETFEEEKRPGAES